jgi:hypothetical protein
LSTAKPAGFRSVFFSNNCQNMSGGGSNSDTSLDFSGGTERVFLGAASDAAPRASFSVTNVHVWFSRSNERKSSVRLAYAGANDWLDPCSK